MAIDTVFAEYQPKGQPGAALGVIKDGKLVYAQGYGRANLEYQASNTPDTVFHVASVSKQFTCFAILLLTEDGRLKLDDDIRKHLEWMPDFGTTISIRHLMLHTSGFDFTPVNTGGGDGNSLTININPAGFPPFPPITIVPVSITVGGQPATYVSRPSLYVIHATFDSSVLSAGTYPILVTMPTPGGNMVFTAQNSVTIPAP